MAHLAPAVLADPIALTRALCDIESVSGNETEIADAVEAALRTTAHLRVDRLGNTVVARTRLGRQQRVVLAGHLDTVPLADNFPSSTTGDVMHGCGTSDMKSGTAIAVNAIHGAGEVLRRLGAYAGRQVTIDGCDYREGLNAVGISGGVAGNVIADVCLVDVSYRFAPDRSVAQAQAHLRDVFDGFTVEIVDSAAGAMPNLDGPAAKEFIEMVGQPPIAKFGWTDVACFAALGRPALNFGPDDPNLAHRQDERVELPKIRVGAETMRRWLS